MAVLNDEFTSLPIFRDISIDIKHFPKIPIAEIDINWEDDPKEKNEETKTKHSTIRRIEL